MKKEEAKSLMKCEKYALNHFSVGDVIYLYRDNYISEYSLEELLDPNNTKDIVAIRLGKKIDKDIIALSQ